MSEIHDTRTLHGIDLNLLVALDALTRERSVTKAAERAGVTQSAMSHTLRRLRELLDDPLLVRGRGGLLSLARILAEPHAFNPGEATRTFRIVSPDLFDALVLPALLRRIGREAPSVDLAVVPTPKRLADSLETGDVDLAIYPVLLDPKPFDLGAEVAPELQSRTLFRDSFRCFVRAGHPLLAKRRFTAEAYAGLDHVLVSPGGEGPGVVDRVLRQQGLERRIALRVPHFATALEVVRQSDLVLSAPSSLAKCTTASTLVSRAIPIDVPEHAITMIWHPRFGEDPGHRWLRDLMVEVTDGVPSLPKRQTRRRP
jgi:DNA-binding transcriptional LysR family regulator